MARGLSYCVRLSSIFQFFLMMGKGSLADAGVERPLSSGSLGINLSDENGNTKANPLAKRERRIVVKGEELFFWWHSKLEPHQNRIHICPGKIPAGGKMIVGIFCLHLAT